MSVEELAAMSEYKYKVGGSLDSHDLTYVVRRADSDLYNALKAGEFCYVLNSRQMGKSSLLVRAMKKLQSEGTACACIALTLLGSDSLDAEKWYAGIASELLDGLNLSGEVDFKAWWGERDFLPPVQRLRQLFEEVVFANIPPYFPLHSQAEAGDEGGNLVIFIDDLENCLKIPLKDDFFAFLRACYNKRAENAAYNRLTFCLLGVATPADLIADRERTPFNIGRAIELTCFTLEEAKAPLTPGLAQKAENPEMVLEEVLKWTGGQPFLTQKLCEIISTSPSPPHRPHKGRGGESQTVSVLEIEASAEVEAEWVAELVRRHMIDDWESHDAPEHLRTIRERLLRNEQLAGRLLGVCQLILKSPQPLLSQGERDSQPLFITEGRDCQPPFTNAETAGVPADGSPEQTELRLSGLAVKKDGYLQIYNPIYAAVFTLDWVGRELANLRPYREAIAAWLASNRQDKSRLLRGQALEEALAWGAGKNLSAEDEAFLSASQQEAELQVQKELLAERQVKQLLAEAKQQGEQLLKQAHKVAKEGTKLERAGLMALREFESGSGQIKALLTAMQAGQALLELQLEGSPLLEYPATSPLLALQVILNDIRERNQFTGHQGPVESVCFSPDGRKLATGSHDGTVRLWDLLGNPITLKGHKDWVTSVCFSPNGKFLATGSYDGTVRLWDLSGNPLAIREHPEPITSLCFCRDGRFLAIGFDDGTARLWNMSGKQITVKGHQDTLWSVCISPNRRFLATGSADRTVRLWDLSGNLIIELKGHQDEVWSVCFSPDSQLVASASSDRTVRVWDLSGNPMAEFKGHQGPVWSVCFSPDGRFLATGSRDRTAQLWKLPPLNKGGQGGSASGNQMTAILTGHQDAVTSVCFSPDGRFLATGSLDRTARLWDLSAKQIVLRGHRGPVESVCFSPDSQSVATASDDRTVRLWDLSGKQIGAFRAHQGPVESVCFSPDGRFLATGSDDRTAKLWELSGKQIVEFTGHEDWVKSVCFSGDGRFLATGSHDCTARLWDLSGKPIAEFTGHEDWVKSVSISPDGRLLATVSDDGTLRLWELSGSPIAVFQGHQGPVKSVCFSPDSQFVATGSDDRTAKLWSLSGSEITLKGHQGAVKSVCISADGRFLATGSADRTARLWDLSGNLIAEFRGHQGPVETVCFSPDGRFVATGSPDGTARLWGAQTLEELLKRGCEWLGDYFAGHPEVREKLRVCG
ncbi:MAG: AAA-like domain-containing protein [Oscillatoria princeps RMCB-10]|jgi:WD40 repeat protein|nr:AAA-like domain-containing protein [Oscillatoria princeps RMCB-10]